MKRWNGWGREDFNYDLALNAREYLLLTLGKGDTSPDSSIEDALKSIPRPRSPAHPLVSSDPEERLRHARGQSLPDWTATRCGRIESFPEGVAFPQSDEDIQELIGYAKLNRLKLIPYGGGTSVLGHINPPGEEFPALTLDMTRMNRLLDFDNESHLATFEAGIRGPDLEFELKRRGFTFGHYPQSFEYSTLGGWIVTRSCGQQSYYYGRIEDNFLSGHVETPIGPIDLPSFPASAAGPDLKQLLLGSEGRIGVLTRATVRVRPLPRVERFMGIFFHDWDFGLEAVKSVSQSGIPVSMMRLSDAMETEITLVLSGKERLAGLARSGLSLVGIREQRCLLILGITGDRDNTSSVRNEAIRVCRKFGGLNTGNLIGDLWKKSRFTTPYLRNTLWESGYALDTLETALPWIGVRNMETNVKEAITRAAARSNLSVLVFSHLSHVYRTGASLYFTYIFPRSSDPERILEGWRSMKQAASQAIIDTGGTISHQHGVGRDHTAYMEHEKGRLGLHLLAEVTRICDPDSLMNPGVLLASEIPAVSMSE